MPESVLVTASALRLWSRAGRPIGYGPPPMRKLLYNASLGGAPRVVLVLITKWLLWASRVGAAGFVTTPDMRESTVFTIGQNKGGESQVREAPKYVGPPINHHGMGYVTL